MDDFALGPAERALLRALNDRGVRFLIVGMGATLLEGAPVSTQDLGLWLERIDDPRVPLAARDAGGFWIPQFGMQPPGFGGTELQRLDVVLIAHGLEPFDEEYRNAVVRDLDDITGPSSAAAPNHREQTRGESPQGSGRAAGSRSDAPGAPRHRSRVHRPLRATQCATMAITIDDFNKVDIRVGRIVDVGDPEARKPPLGGRLF